MNVNMEAYEQAKQEFEQAKEESPEGRVCDLCGVDLPNDPQQIFKHIMTHPADEWKGKVPNWQYKMLKRIEKKMKKAGITSIKTE